MKANGASKMTSDSSPEVVPWRNSHEENRRTRQAKEREKASAHQCKLQGRNDRGKPSVAGVMEDDTDLDSVPPPSQSGATNAEKPESRHRALDRKLSSAEDSCSTQVGAVLVPGIAAAAAAAAAAPDPEEGETCAFHDHHPETFVARDTGRGDLRHRDMSSAESSSSTPGGAVVSAPTTAVTPDPEEGEIHTNYGDHPGTVVANAVTKDDLADEIRVQMRSEIRQELQAQMKQTAVHAEAVSTVEIGSNTKPLEGNESIQPFWRRKCVIIVAVITLVAVVIAGVLGVLLSGRGKSGDGSVTGRESEVTGPQSTSSPTPRSTEWPSPPPGETPSPSPTTSEPPTDPSSTQLPTLMSTQAEVSLSFMQRLEGRNDAGDRFGGYVIISGDGTTMAVGAQSGQYVRVYRRNGNEWDRLGQTIESSGEFGGRLDLSRDGNVLAVGASEKDDAGTNSGQVRVYEYISGSWTRRGQNLNGYENEDKFGWAVALSDDGLTVAASARLGDPSSDRVDAGYVLVFSYIGDRWEQVGDDINGKNPGGQFGRSISLDSSGRRIAVGENRGGSGAGRVHVFDLVGAQWNTVGQPLDGEAVEDWQGTAVALSADGKTVAVAADGNDRNGNNAGLVRVYQLNGCCTWEQVGQNILGEVGGDQFGAGHISLSDDGSFVAVGALHNNNDKGKAYLYQFINPSGWTKAGEVPGDSPGDKFGDTVTISGDGSYFAVGAPSANSNRGYVQVYFVR